MARRHPSASAAQGIGVGRINSPTGVKAETKCEYIVSEPSLPAQDGAGLEFANSIIEKHVALVAVVYSLLRAAQQDPTLRDRLQRELKMELEGSVAFWRRATQAQSLWSLAVFISAGLAQGQTLQQVMAPLLKVVCAA